ncbi:TPA: hypothetical protein EYP38_01330, partial [Candidatus Micrarchaeota archaeon]|nr:hypothetical protein [Candidatus Micrarchaeota archaeon]
MRIPLIQELEPQDNLSVFGAGSGTAGDIEQVSILVGYEMLSGISAKLTRKSVFSRNAREIFCVRSTISPGTSGGYSGSESIAADQDQFKANQLYAVLGAWASEGVTTIGLKSPDWGNLRIGLPGRTSPRVGAGYFLDLSERLGDADVIPVFNSSNREVTTID